MGRWCNSGKQDEEIDEKVKTFLGGRYWLYLFLTDATYMSDGPGHPRQHMVENP
jgi:hypothetical protein